MTSLGLRADIRQHAKLSPRLQNAVRLLQMSSIEYAQQLGQLLDRNPFLEIDDGEDSGPLVGIAETAAVQDPPDSNPPESPDAATAAALSDTQSAATEERLDADDREPWHDDPVESRQASAQGSDDGEGSIFDRMSDEVTLGAHLHAQLDLLPLSGRDRLLAEAIIDSLDDDGYLRLDLAELPAIAGLNPPADADEVQIALHHVQSLEPTGVAARSVAECLRLQSMLMDCPRERELAQRIVTDHLQELAARDLNGLSRRLGASRAEVDAVCQRIRHFNPRPGGSVGASTARYLAPDVVVRKQRGQWTADLNQRLVPRIRLNVVYATMFERHRGADNAELAGHLQEAKWTVRNVEQRFATILAVSQEIVRRQSQFFEYGPLAMKPLALREVAAQVGVHESTVSRVTNNKYMQTPLGVFELKFFFSRAMATASGGACTGTAIRGLIREMIAEETADAPLSDAQIARQLAMQGVVVARRTVTKYRQAMKFDSVGRRRLGEAA